MDQAESLRKLAKTKEKKGPTVAAVASGKGGTGKTSFCINLAIALSGLGKSTMIVDADFGLSNVDVMLDAHPKHNIGEVLQGVVPLSEAVCKGHGGIWYVSGGSGEEAVMRIRRDMLKSLQKQMAELGADLDYILIDCGAGVNETMLRMIASADECLLVVTPEPTAITDAFVLLKTLAARQEKLAVSFVMNRADTPLEAMTMSRYFKNIVSKYLGFEIYFLGQVAFDKNVINSINKQMPLMLSYPNSPAAKDILRIAGQYANVETPRSSGGLPGFFEKIAMRYGK